MAVPAVMMAAAVPSPIAAARRRGGGMMASGAAKRPIPLNAIDGRLCCVLNTTHPAEKFMAQRIQTLFIDDIDGGEADGTVRFGLDGADYEIDLSGEHSDELRGALGKYIEHSRKVAGAGRRSPRGRGGAHAVDTAKVREWAKGNGYEIKDRGRVPADLLAKYQAATGA